MFASEARRSCLSARNQNPVSGVRELCDMGVMLRGNVSPKIRFGQIYEQESAWLNLLPLKRYRQPFEIGVLCFPCFNIWRLRNEVSYGANPRFVLFNFPQQITTTWQTHENMTQHDCYCQLVWGINAMNGGRCVKICNFCQHSVILVEYETSICNAAWNRLHHISCHISLIFCLNHVPKNLPASLHSMMQRYLSRLFERRWLRLTSTRVLISP